MKYCFNISRTMNVSFEKSKELFTNFSKPIFTLFVIGILLVILYQIYTRIIRKKIRLAEYQLLTDADSTGISFIPSGELTYLSDEKKDTEEDESVTGKSIADPYDQYSYTILLRMRIHDYVENLGYWKHVLHKGTHEKGDDVWEFDTWDKVTAHIPVQNPGLWLHPATNTLRFCLNTTISHKYLSIPEHGDMTTSVSRREIEKEKSREEYRTPMTQIEYVDIPNIPVNRDVNLAIIVDRTNITVLKNGVNYLFTQTEGLPKINPGPITVHHKTTYNGEIKDFSILPFPLDKKNKKNFL